MEKVESMHPVINRVLCGRLSEGGDYATWRRRGTSDFLLIHTLSGSGKIRGEQGEFVTEVGDSILLRPGVLHDYATAASALQWEIAFAHFQPRADWMPLLDWPQRAGTVGHITTSGAVHSRVAAALQAGTSMRSGAFPRRELFAVNALEEALLWIDTQNPLSTRLDDRVLKVVEHIGDHLAADLSIDRLAAVAHVSPSRLSHLFRAQLDITPQKYVERERMLLAQQLLNLTDRPIADIARQLGWDDPLYFSQRFRRFSRMSPTRYRSSGREL